MIDLSTPEKRAKHDLELGRKYPYHGKQPKDWAEAAALAICASRVSNETPCACCGMVCTPGEYHPYAACLMFKACHNGNTVRANLEAVLSHARAGASVETSVAPSGIFKRKCARCGNEHASGLAPGVGVSYCSHGCAD